MPEKIEGRDTTIPSANETQSIGLLNLVIKKRQGDLLRLNRIKEKLNNKKNVRLKGGSLGNQMASFVCFLCFFFKLSFVSNKKQI